MLIQHKQAGTKGSFFIAKEEMKLAEMAYTMPSADKMIIEHTEVSDELREKSRLPVGRYRGRICKG